MRGWSLVGRRSSVGRQYILLLTMISYTPLRYVRNIAKRSNQTVNDGVAHSKNPRKCTYHVTFDLDLDLEHTLDAR